MLQWGRDREVADRPLRTLGRPEDYCFNGAATVRSRIVSDLSVSPATWFPLQWGRDREVADSDHQQRERQTHGDASMGPRP